MKARLLILSAVALVACRDLKPPAEMSGPPDPSKIISDGAHGGNKDFFFLPPMVQLPIGNADFELGKFNNTLKASLRIEICELMPEKVNGVQVLPKGSTLCVTGNPLKTFPAGTVNLVNLPLKQNGWWTLFNLPSDGFYYVLWDTRQSNLLLSSYYRIKVFIAGASEPLGVADVDPMSSLREWKYSLTGEVIQLVDDVLLPIPFRVEKGGGSTLCGDASQCFSATVTNSSPTGSQTVTVDNGAGAVAGAKFPNGWLPVGPGLPQSVVVTIASVDLGGTDPVTGTATRPCHTGLQLQQFPGCFKFTTTPHLAAIDETGRQFATPVTVAVCYALQDKSPADPREKFAEMYASGPNEPPRALDDASDVGILSPTTRNCSAPPVITAAPTSGWPQLASASWTKIKNGVGSVFGVKTAYGVDLGLGGIATRFSNIGPAISATIHPVGSPEITQSGGGNIQVYVRLIGSNHHDGQHQNSVGLPNLPVHFQLAAGNGAIADIGDEVGSATQVDVVTNSIPIDESPVSGGGYAAVNWAVPNTPGVYHLTVDGAAYGGPVTFTVTVTSTLLHLRTFALDNFAIAFRGNGLSRSTPEGVEISEGQVNYSALLSDEFRNAETFPTRIAIDQRAMSANNISLRGVFRDLQMARGSLELAIAQTALEGEGAPSPADLLVESGFADVLAAENYCSGVPTSQVQISGAMAYGPQQSTLEILHGAVGKFDQAIALAAADPDLATLGNAAKIGKARALLDLNDPSGAVEATIQVPTFFSFSIQSTSDIPQQNNGIVVMQEIQRRYTVADGEGGNGLPYRSDLDPRVGYAASAFGFDNTTPMFFQQKYSLGSAVPLAQGFEGRLIEAEFYLGQNNLAAMLVSLNAARVANGLPALPAFTDFNQALLTLFKERAYTLWLTSHRLGDMRRIMRQYDRTQFEVFPIGDYPKGGVYGTDVNFPIPVDPLYNPTGVTCFDRNP